MEKTPFDASFRSLGLAPKLLSILGEQKFIKPTPIQRQCIPSALEGKDIVGIAQTGTGKTLAFGLPILQLLARHKGQCLIILPTRELAQQVDEVLHKIGKSLGLKTAVIIGGAAMGRQVQQLRGNPHIVIATPGRLADHLKQKTYSLNLLKIIVLDEADRMLDIGFLPEISRILQAASSDRQTMLFSATMPAEIMKMATAHMKLPIRVEIAPTGTTVERVTQELFIVGREQKILLLEKLLQTYQGSTLIFARTKHGAKKVAQQIRAFGISAAELHSNRSLNQRREALEGFKAGKYRVLAATDIASRGIDVVGIELVLNYDLPSTSEDYVHRIGRTARAGAGGHAITFATPDQQKEIWAIERLIRKPLSVSKLPELPPVQVFSPPHARAHLYHTPRHHSARHSARRRSRHGRY